jgi:hypothetical protein
MEIDLNSKMDRNLDLESQIQNAQSVKELTIKALVSEGLISKEEGLMFSGQYQIIVTKKNLFKQMFDTIFQGRKEGIYYYDVVKIIKL